MNKIKRLPVIDVQYDDITPAIYELLFCTEIGANDCYHKINIWDYDEKSEFPDFWKERLARGPNNCYRNHKDMVKFHKNPCTYGAAVKEFKQWLLDRGVEEGEKIIAKIWW